jgi:uncharacterized membrane protein
MKTQNPVLQKTEAQSKQLINNKDDRGAITGGKKEKSASSTERDIGLDRLVFFSDAVIAIAITLLAIDLRLPDMQGGTVEQLSQFLTDFELPLISFIISFFVIGMFWMAHHRIFLYIRHYDRTLLWINLIFLFLVVSMPFPTSVLANFGETTLGVILYASVVVVIALVRTWLWRYATHNHRLVDENLSDALIRNLTISSLMTAGVFLLSIVIALFNPYLAEISWVITTALTFAIRS